MAVAPDELAGQNTADALCRTAAEEQGDEAGHLVSHAAPTALGVEAEVLTQNVEDGSRHIGRKAEGKIHGEQVTHARRLKNRRTRPAEPMRCSPKRH
ncbi:hypothetical protein GCM10009564_51940 [Streptomyces thermogriseus]|uniref:Transposase n=1 Tax=Streptomyces thermogriseus TaxID=75292 RepID=A0ABP4DRZ0_9ACTN